MIVYSPFYFQFFFLGVYKRYTKLMCIASHWYIIFHWNTTYWHMLTGFDISTSIHQVYTTYCWNSNIFFIGLILCGWYSEVYSAHFIFVTAWLSPDVVYPFYCIYTLYTVYTLHVLPLPHWSPGFTYTKRIHLVYSLIF